MFLALVVSKLISQYLNGRHDRDILLVPRGDWHHGRRAGHDLRLSPPIIRASVKDARVVQQFQALRVEIDEGLGHAILRARYGRLRLEDVAGRNISAGQHIQPRLFQLAPRHYQRFTLITYD